MTPGLVNSVLCDEAPRPRRVCVQMTMLPTDTRDELVAALEMERNDLRQQVTDCLSEWDRLVDAYQSREDELRQLRRTVAALEHRLELYTRVLVHGTPGVVRGRS